MLHWLLVSPSRGELGIKKWERRNGKNLFFHFSFTYIQSTVGGVLEREDVDRPVGVVPAAEDRYEADGGAGEPDDDDGDEEPPLADVSSVAQRSGDGPKSKKENW